MTTTHILAALAVVLGVAAIVAGDAPGLELLGLRVILGAGVMAVRAARRARP